VLIAIAAAVGLYLRVSQGNLRAKAQAAVVEEICSTNVVTDVIAAYPQASMSREDLDRMTLGEGLEKLKVFHAELPTVLYPTVSHLYAADASAWGYLTKASRDGLADAKAGRTQAIKALTGEILSSAKQRCPAKVSSPFAEFALGAMLGHFATQAVN